MRASIHLRRHDHHVQNDMCKESMEEIKALVEKEVYTPNTNNIIINFGIASSQIYPCPNTYSMKMEMTMLNFLKPNN
jgi:hypothetical protein